MPWEMLPSFSCIKGMPIFLAFKFDFELCIPHKSISLKAIYKKTRPGDERTPPFFIKRKRLRLLPAAEKPPNPGSCSRGPSLAASTARGFFYPTDRKFAPHGNRTPATGVPPDALDQPS